MIFSNKVIKIYTADDLKKFRDRVNNGEWSLSAELMNDIDISETDEKGDRVSWVPIGAGNEKKFSPYIGVFDGKGYTVSGLYINEEYDPNKTYEHYKSKFFWIFSADCNAKGLFGVSYGVIKNLTVDGSVKVDNPVEWEIDGVGGICGESSGVIENCVNKCTIECPYQPAAGIVGKIRYNGSVHLCENKGEISGCGDQIGGIFGAMDKNNSMEHVSQNTNSGLLRFLYGRPTWDMLAANKYQVNQIGPSRSSVKNCVQKGHVEYGTESSILGEMLRMEDSFPPLKHLEGALAADPDPEVTDSRGQTYLHLVCYKYVSDYCSQNPRPDPPYDIVNLLAEKTNIDFNAKDRNGTTAADYLALFKTKDTQDMYDFVTQIATERAEQDLEEEMER